jgi:cytochrome c oxidase cbb3-type subunit 1
MKKTLILLKIKLSKTKIALSAFLFLVLLAPVLAQPTPNPDTENWLASPGIIGTLILVALVLMIAILIVVKRASSILSFFQRKNDKMSVQKLREELYKLEGDEIDEVLQERKASKTFQLSGKELQSEGKAVDSKGIVTMYTHDPQNPLVDEKKRSRTVLAVPSELRKLVVWFLGAGVFWLVFGTTVGQYLGMKFMWPEMDHVSFLSFGRLRPVHTNTVFWGWASLTMIGLGYFVIAKTSNTTIYKYSIGWASLILINLTLIIGNICLMSGVNNGGGEYREYIWPVMTMFAIGLILTFFNFYKTIQNRKIGEIYISNWYIMGALVWTIVLSIIGYLPWYQNGLGETVVQGYYMHQGVGMWFMTFTLGLVYYYLPSSLNKPIYSYSLGVLAFWTQMLFYTMIGTHHFVFSPLPWWLQTVAIVFSAGMFIPVVAGTTNFMMTMRGSWNDISKSYVLPFFLVGVVFYFVGSTQGSLQAFRFTNFVWHFTDFNVAHSHMTMYGIITFILWACIYALLPKITGSEPKQLLVGIHFWLAFIGLFAYMTSLMAGGTLKGLSWIAGENFINSVVLMQPYWVWRAIGGSLMFISHLIFAFNFYQMVKIRPSAPTPKIVPMKSTLANV